MLKDIRFRWIFTLLLLFWLTPVKSFAAKDQVFVGKAGYEDARAADFSDFMDESSFHEKSFTDIDIRFYQSEKDGESTEDTGLFFSQLNETEQKLYQSCRETDYNDNAVTIIHYMEAGETASSVWKEFHSYYAKVLYAWKYDDPVATWWTDSSVGAFANVEDDYIILVAYYGVSDFYRPEIDAEAMAVIDTVVSKAPMEDDYLKVLYAARWLCDNTVYDETALTMDMDTEWFWHAHGPLGVLLKNEGVCESYAKVFKILMNRFSIPCVIVSSEEHMWNYVKMPDGLWYLVDTTFADQSSGMYFKYILNPQPVGDKSHVQDDVFLYPETAAGSYGNHSLDLISGSASASCSTDGSASYRCRDCRQEYTIPLPARHSLGRGYVTKEAGCLTEGVRSRVCSQCGFQVDRLFPALGHEYTDFVCDLCGDVKKIKKPVLSTVKNLSGGVKLTWNAVSGAVRYRVMRKTSETDYAVIGNTTSTSFTDHDVENGIVYTYTVYCVNDANKKKVSAYEKNGLPITRLAPPVITKISNIKGGIRVYIKEQTGAESFYVTYKTRQMDSYKKAGTTHGQTIDITGLSSGYTMEVHVKAYDKDGGSASVFSDVFSRMYLNCPSIKSIENNKKKTVTLTWNKMGGAKSYDVFRKIKGGEYERIARIDGKENVTYVDKGLKVGQTYTYSIRAVRGDVTSVKGSGISIKVKK